VRVGMEASGHARWFERLLAELNFELWIGDATEIARLGQARNQQAEPRSTVGTLRSHLFPDFVEWTRSVPRFRNQNHFQ